MRAHRDAGVGWVAKEWSTERVLEDVGARDVTEGGCGGFSF